MVDLSNLRLITAGLDTTLAKDIMHPDFPTTRFSVFKDIIDKLDNFVIVVDSKLKVVMVNKITQELIQKHVGVCINPGDDWYKVVFKLDSPPSWDPLTRALETRKVVIKRIDTPYSGLTFNTINIPLIHNGTSGVVGIGVEDFNGE